ncbi:MAG: O-methyltransferase [Bacteroidetes bacterium]|nr:O-methyltransferase [Bacteroidota bacterium]MBU1680735.1 O-methyltransferase [Bacteroidota bacterium]MBU2507246.1 O-methyltransferase [Bacteroidota bacterium]
MTKILLKAQDDYLSSFKVESKGLIDSMEKYAEQNRIPILNWLSADYLEILVRIHKPRRVLEIGTAIGYSAIRIASALGKKGVIDTIEKSEDNIALAKANIEESGFKSRINILEGDALDVMPKLKKKYEMIYLDADKEDYERLFYFALMLLKKNGMFVADNLLWQGYAASKDIPDKFRSSTKHIREFNILFTSQTILKSVILPIGDGLGVGIKTM